MTVMDTVEGRLGGLFAYSHSTAAAHRGFDRFVAAELAKLLKLIVAEYQQRLQVKFEQGRLCKERQGVCSLRDARTACEGPSDSPCACQQALPPAPFAQGEPELVNVPTTTEEEIRHCGDETETLLVDATAVSACMLPAFEDVVGKQMAALRASMVAEFQQMLAAAIRQTEHGSEAIAACPHPQTTNSDQHLEMLCGEQASHGERMCSDRNDATRVLAATEQVEHEGSIPSYSDDATRVRVETEDVDGLGKQWWNTDTNEGDRLSQERIPLSDNDVLLLVKAMRKLDLAMDQRSLVMKALAGRVLSCCQAASLLTAIQMGLVQRIVAIEVLASRLTDLPTGLPQILEPLSKPLRGEVERKLMCFSVACNISDPCS